MDFNENTYRSVRVNGKKKIDVSRVVGKMYKLIDGSKYRNSKIKYRVRAKLNTGFNGLGQVRLLIGSSDGSSHAERVRVTDNNWKLYEAIGTTDSSTVTIEVGCILKGKGPLQVDKIELSYLEGNKWVDIPLTNNNFEIDSIMAKKQNDAWVTEGTGYSFNISDHDSYEGKKSMIIDFADMFEEKINEQLFNFQPEFGEIIEKKVGENIFCKIPLVLYSKNGESYPKPTIQPSEKLDKKEYGVQQEIDLYCRLGNIINTYNVFKHFYPYMDAININWDAELEKALSRCYRDTTKNDHVITLEKFTAPLRDGHISITGGTFGRFTPSFSWEWIENQLVVTKIFNQNSPIKVGDVITHIDKRGANDHFQEIYSRISAGSEGWLKYKAQTLGLMGNENSTILITVNGKEIELKRTDYSNAGLSERDIYKKINDSVFYMDITRIQMDTIRELLPQLNNSKSIICDLRGRPNLNHDFISHLLKENDTTLTWMRIPQVVYPDQANIAGYEMRNWLLKSKKPYLGDKQIIFITDGQAISYSESYLGFIEGYNLATIIGQPTAGTNGNINQFDLPGGLSVIWTGMKVVKHNGTQQHGTGIIPDIYVNKTIEGVKLNKDEFLERAIELTSDKNYNN